MNSGATHPVRLLVEWKLVLSNICPSHFKLLKFFAPGNNRSKWGDFEDWHRGVRVQSLAGGDHHGQLWEEDTLHLPRVGSAGMKLMYRQLWSKNDNTLCWGWDILDVMWQPFGFVGSLLSVCPKASQRPFLNSCLVGQAPAGRLFETCPEYNHWKATFRRAGYNPYNPGNKHILGGECAVCLLRELCALAMLETDCWVSNGTST